MSAPLTIRAFARLDGCDESLVRRAIRTGRLTRDDGGRLDPSLVGTAWRGRPDDRARCPTCGQLTSNQSGRAAPRPGTLDAERARLTSAQAEAMERKNAIEAGKLVSLDEISFSVTAVITRIMAFLDHLPARLSAGDYKLRARIEKELNHARTELADTKVVQIPGDRAPGNDMEDDDGE